MKKNVVVIGSGFGGLATAARLLSKGFDVTIFEKLDRPGGKAYVFEKDGCFFDAGPTVINAPFLLDEIFSLADRKIEDYVVIKELETHYRIFDGNGSYFDFCKDDELLNSQIEKFNYADVLGYEKFINKTKPVFEKVFLDLADKPFLRFKDMLKTTPHLLWLKSYKSVFEFVSKYIKDDFLRHCFTFHPLLIGANPFRNSSIYTLINYMEKRWGVFYAEGGMGALVKAFEKLILDLGGKIEYNSEVKDIIINNGKAVGIKLYNKKIIAADFVVANSDISHTYIDMIDANLPKKYFSSRIDKMKHGLSMFIVYFSASHDYSDSMLEHHNVILNNRYKELISELFYGEKLPEDFALYVYMPTKNDKSLAPSGNSLFYALSPVPNLKADIDWKKVSQKYADRIIGFLDEKYLPDLKRNIKISFYINPLFFRNNYNCYLGSAFSLQPILTQSAWFRPHNISEEFDNLFFVGAGTHPGAGIPGVLSSAKIAEKLILEKS